MKKILIISALVALTIASYSQAPNAFNYQAIIRNANGTIKANETVVLQINIIHKYTFRPSVYFEVHNTTTSELGLVNLVIGEGKTSDDFSLIDWADGPYYLDVAVNDVHIGTSPLLSVPYALHANTADSITETQNLSAVLAKNNDGGTSQIKNIADPTAAQDAATKAYVDALKMVLFQILEPTDLVTAGANVSDLLDAGISIADLWAAGVPVSDMLVAQVTVSDMLAAGLSVLELYEGGVLVGTLEQSGADLADLANAGLIGTVTDYDDNQYKWVRIGNQVWMAENLKTTHYADGSAIPLVESYNEWPALGDSDIAYCWYNNNIFIGNEYGALYTWAAAMNGASSSDSIPSDIQGVCPNGWHMPSDAEWKELEMCLGMSQTEADDTDSRGADEGGKLKETRTMHWYDPNTGATNESGFTALPGGYRHACGAFTGLRSYTFFLTATEGDDASRAWERTLLINSNTVNRWTNSKDLGYSVRCVKDE